MRKTAKMSLAFSAIMVALVGLLVVCDPFCDFECKCEEACQEKGYDYGEPMESTNRCLCEFRGSSVAQLHVEPGCGEVLNWIMVALAVALVALASYAMFAKHLKLALAMLIVLGVVSMSVIWFLEPLAVIGIMAFMILALQAYLFYLGVTDDGE